MRLLKHVMAGTLYTKTLEPVAAQLDPAWFIDHLPKLPKDGELQFWLALGSTAMASFKQSNFEQLPPQRVPGSANANLGNWQASSSFAKAVSFWAWTACRAPELLKEKAYIISFSFPVSKFVAHHKMMKLGNTVTLDFRGADCQLCFWGKQLAGQQQPHLGSLHVRLGPLIVKLETFDQIPNLYDSASFDWGGVSSEHQLAAYWKLDLQQHPTVYQQLADQLGETHPMVIEKELAKEGEEPASTSSASYAFTSFWKDTTKSLQKALGDVVKHAEKLTDDHKQEAEAALQVFNRGSFRTS